MRVGKDLILTKTVRRGIRRFYRGLFFMFFVICLSIPIVVAAEIFSTQIVWKILWGTIGVMIAAVFPLPFFLLGALVEKNLRDGQNLKEFINEVFSKQSAFELFVAMVIITFSIVILTFMFTFVTVGIFNPISGGLRVTPVVSSVVLGIVVNALVVVTWFKQKKNQNRTTSDHNIPVD